MSIKNENSSDQWLKHHIAAGMASLTTVERVTAKFNNYLQNSTDSSSEHIDYICNILKKSWINNMQRLSGVPLPIDVRSSEPGALYFESLDDRDSLIDSEIPEFPNTRLTDPILHSESLLRSNVGRPLPFMKKPPYPDFKKPKETFKVNISSIPSLDDIDRSHHRKSKRKIDGISKAIESSDNDSDWSNSDDDSIGDLIDEIQASDIKQLSSLENSENINWIDEANTSEDILLRCRSRIFEQPTNSDSLNLLSGDSIDQVEDPTMPLAEADIVVMGRLLKISRAAFAWKVKLGDVYLQYKGKDFVFPILRVVIDPKNLIG